MSAERGNAFQGRDAAEFSDAHAGETPPRAPTCDTAGHVHFRAPPGVVHVCVGGPDRVIVVNAAGKRVRFEDHRVFGPTPLDRKGDPTHLGPKHAFWTAVSRWYAGGKRVDAEGACVWEPEPDPRAGMVHLGGRNWATPTLAARMQAKRDGAR